MSPVVKVFISYAREDYETAKRLYDDLKKAGVSPWMDENDLISGQGLGVGDYESNQGKSLLYRTDFLKVCGESGIRSG